MLKIKTMLKSKDFKTSLTFSIIGLIASVFLGVYQTSTFTESMEQQIISQLGSTHALILVAAMQGFLLTFIASFFGLKIAKKVSLYLNFKYDKKSMILAILIGFATGLIITFSDQFIFAKYLSSEMTSYIFSLVYFISSILYGGIVEEILLRLFMMSLLVWILWKLFAKSKDYLNIPHWIYIFSIVLSSILFAAGHLPATAQLFGISIPILIRMFVLNGIGGLGFGYLYWKHGLAYSMVAHVTTHIFMQILFIPILS